MSRLATRQGAARVGQAQHRTSRRNRSGVHRPQPQVVGQEVTEGRVFTHGHGQTCNGVILPHGLGSAVSLQLIGAAPYRGGTQNQSHRSCLLQHAEELASIHSARMDRCSFFKVQKLTARRNQKPFENSKESFVSELFWCIQKANVPYSLANPNQSYKFGASVAHIAHLSLKVIFEEKQSSLKDLLIFFLIHTSNTIHLLNKIGILFLCLLQFQHPILDCHRVRSNESVQYGRSISNE